MARVEPEASLWRAAGLGMELVGAILGMALIGWLVDRWAGTGPYGLWVGLAVGLVGGGANFLRSALALNRREAARYRRQKGSSDGER